MSFYHVADDQRPAPVRDYARSKRPSEGLEVTATANVQLHARVSNAIDDRLSYEMLIHVVDPKPV